MTFDEWWNTEGQRHSDDALHMSEYHMASVVWEAALNAVLADIHMIQATRKTLP
jgi:hypothetical protein